MLPTGHEGPYSLAILETKLADKKIRQDVQVWREGLPVAISLRDVLNELAAPPEEEEDELPPPLPPLPIEEESYVPEEAVTSSIPHEEMPEIPLLDGYEEAKSRKRIPVPVIVGGAIAFIILFGIYQWMKDQEKFEIRRYPKMTLEMHSKIQNEVKFEGFDKKIFFHEYASPDLTHIWLVTSGFQRCDVETIFHSVKTRLLTMGDEEVEFVSRGKLAQHVTELNSFEFRKGTRIIPGYYEMDIKATRCEWDGLSARVRNLFASPEKEYSATTRVILYPRGAEEFQVALTQLLKKKDDLKKQSEGQELLFWDDLQMKFQTLHSISLQIEQLMLDFLDKGPKDFPVRLKEMTKKYTKSFGSALTEFVNQNEGYFDGLRDTDLRPLLTKKDYEGMIRTSSKQVGMESMKVIEKLQAMKKPSAAELKTLRTEVLKNFEKLKNNLNNHTLQITEDRTNSQD